MEKRKHFNVFYISVADLEEKLNELHATGYNVVQVLPTGGTRYKSDIDVNVKTAEVAIVSIQLPSPADLQAEVSKIRSQNRIKPETEK